MARGNQSNVRAVVRFFDLSPMEDSGSPFYLHNSTVTLPNEHSVAVTRDRMQGKMIEMGRCRGNLYVLNPTNLFPIPSSVTTICNIASKTEHELWHYHLGHPFYNRLNSLKDVLNLKLFVGHPLIV
ncbi:hypothetical protein CK203_064222 [Vitis vinifera]|uniref:GAG-pre-integrase domain-containing protein n=1 Tax=Vitis vinifera TaxID=29760 RepID=A0A438G3A7_VITVI|nr:hypothetical protein CK203_064222 [Vitis vinifera]